MVHASRPGVQVLGRHGGSAERGVPCSLPVLMGHVIVAHSPMMQETHGEKPLRLALIGMSGSGKTFWTKRLAEAGRPSISCDDQIEQRLVSRLAVGGVAGINGVGAWMGVAGHPPFAGSGAHFLAEEIYKLGEGLNGVGRDMLAER